MSDSVPTASTPENVQVPGQIAITVEADPTVGYASAQNSVPVVRAISVTNASDRVLKDCTLRLTCDPPFARGLEVTFAELLPGESRRISPVSLHPNHDYLANLEEAVSASLRAEALIDGKPLGSADVSVEVLAYDQWAGSRSLPELLAAFCMPNNPAVDVLVRKASDLLRQGNPDLSMNGYTSQHREHVWAQVSAIYNALRAEQIHYAMPPASFGSLGQKIRTPDRLLAGRLGTCLDLAMLFASCIEQAGLRPVVLIKDGHAWAGVWLHEGEFSDPLIDDPREVRKRIDLGQLIVFETTGIAQDDRHQPSLRVATEAGHAYLNDAASFRFLIDIARARQASIRPLPSRRTVADPVEASQGVAPPAIESPPALPPLEVISNVRREDPTEETPDQRLQRWQAKLLDLTRRNRLLNFKPTKATLQLADPDLPGLEDLLADGVEFRIRGLPTMMEGADPRDPLLHRLRHGTEAIHEFVQEALRRKELVFSVDPDKLAGHLQAIHNGARLALEEGGSNTLFLTIGMLRWTETPTAEKASLAPILLIPVTISRQSVSSGYRLTRHDDETIINHTLLEFLKREYEITVKVADPLPADDSGIDVNLILQQVRLAVAEQRGWEVLPEAHLGLFSFTKYLMWKDLKDRSRELKENRVVKHLIENPGQTYPQDPSGIFREGLDDINPCELIAPLLADSSQLRALATVDAGKDVVLEGPPGTGKSQTITNIVAHALTEGKTVLFVSEKMAALSVVHRRLEAIGLGPFCLELHSAKAQKNEVLRQFKRSLDARAGRTSDEWRHEAERLQNLRSELNALVQVLHHRHHNGLTVHKAIGATAGIPVALTAQFTWPDPDQHTADDVDGLRDLARQIQISLERLGPPSQHPLSGIGWSSWTPAWQSGLMEAIADTVQAIERFEAQVAGFVELFGIHPDSVSLPGLRDLDLVAERILAAPDLNAGVVRAATRADTRSRLEATIKHGLYRQDRWSKLAGSFRDSLAGLDASSLQTTWALATSQWWPKSWLTKRSVIKELQPHARDAVTLEPEQTPSVLECLAEVNREDAFLQDHRTWLAETLLESFEGARTAWRRIEAQVEWVRSADATLHQLAALGSDDAERLSDAILPRSGHESLLSRDRQKALQEAAAYRRGLVDLMAALDRLESMTTPTDDWAGRSTEGGYLLRLKSELARVTSAQADLQPWCRWQDVRGRVAEAGLSPLIGLLDAGTIRPEATVEAFDRSYARWWLLEMFNRTPALASYSGAAHTQLIEEFRAVDQRFQELTKQQTIAQLCAGIPTSTGRVDPDSELGRLSREMAKTRRHLPVRQLVHGMPTLLPRLKPCLLMSPLSIAQYLPAGGQKFDLVVFDEASQIPTWDAVGAIARGTQVVVVGDPKQLPPTSFFAASFDETDAYADETVEDLESILDECRAVRMHQESLDWHYRSRHESLITFSNVRYYESRLITFPSPVTQDSGVRFVHVGGTYDRGGSRTNRLEAEAVVEAIAEHYLTEGGPAGSVGVVTFNAAQQALIEQLLDARRGLDRQLDATLAESGDEPLFIKNLENVQGDERDVIFFSTTFGKDPAGKFTMNFGPLNGEGGHRRLNVAITRARSNVVVYSSLTPDQMELSRIRSAGVRDLKNYLEFAQRGPRALVEQSLPTDREPDSPFERQVARALRDKGWEVHPQVGCSGYRIDLGIVDPRAPGRYLAGVECDGAMYHSAATARDRDRLRQMVLEQLGWKLVRVWSTDWWLNPDREIRQVHAMLESLLEVPIPDSLPPRIVTTQQLDRTESVDDASEEFPADHPPPPAIELPVYRPSSVAGGRPDAFYELQHGARIRDQLLEVIEDEGPILDEVLFRRVARAWGLQRTGSRIVERLQKLIPSIVRKTGGRDERFYWPASLDPEGWSGFRVGVDDASNRTVYEVAQEELANMICHVLDQSGASSEEGIARAVSRLCGMARTPADAQDRIGKVLRKLEASGRVVESAHGFHLA